MDCGAATGPASRYDQRVAGSGQRPYIQARRSRFSTIVRMIDKTMLPMHPDDLNLTATNSPMLVTSAENARRVPG